MLLAGAFLWSATYSQTAKTRASEAKSAVSQKQKRAQIKRARKLAVDFLLGNFTKTGAVKDEAKPADLDYGIRTIASLYALRTAGVLESKKSRQRRRAMNWSAKAKLNSTRALSWRIIMLCEYNIKVSYKIIKSDAAALLRCANQRGQFGIKLTPPADDNYDNISTALAQRALSAARIAGFAAPAKFWKRALANWKTQQLKSGGFGYRLRKRAGKPWTNPYGSATAASLTGWYYCANNLATYKSLLRCKNVTDSKLADRATAWLDKNFSAEFNPQKNLQGYYDWLMYLDQIGQQTGRKYLGSRPWFDAVSKVILTAQNADGSFGYDSDTLATAKTLVFLINSNRPVYISKVHYPGDWNTRPRDLANATAYLRKSYENNLGWCVADADKISATSRWGRVLYISGSDAVKFTPKQTAELRKFVLAGGLIISDNACENPRFKEAVFKLYRELFPRYQVLKLKSPSVVFPKNKSQANFEASYVISNGIRPLAYHFDQDLSLPLHLGITRAGAKSAFKIFANIYLQLSDNGRSFALPKAPSVDLQKYPRVINLARINHRGGADPEPAGLGELTKTLAAVGVDLKVSKLMRIAKLRVENYPVAYLTGTRDMMLTQAEQNQLVKYVKSGGVIVCDSAGSSVEFTRSLTRFAEKIGKLEKSPKGWLDQTGLKLDKVKLISKSGKRQNQTAVLYHVNYKNRPAIIFSPVDLAAGLVGYPLSKLERYVPADARKILSAMVLRSRDLTVYKTRSGAMRVKNIDSAMK